MGNPLVFSLGVVVYYNIMRRQRGKRPAMNVQGQKEDAYLGEDHGQTKNTDCG